MTDTFRRISVFVAAFIGGVGLLVALLWLFAQPPRSATPASRSVTPTPWIVAKVDDEPILFGEWKQAVAVDQAMSALVGQTPPSPEETLNRLVNERLVIRAADAAAIPEVDRAQAEAWLASFLTSFGLDETTLDQALARADLTRADLTQDIVPRLLRVEQTLEESSPDGDSERWVIDLRRQARVTLLENLPTLEALNLSAITPTTASPSSLGSPQSTPVAASLPLGPRAGDLAPDFSLTTIGGAMVQLSDLRGQPVLLNFWATWCSPCREELTMLQAVYDDGLAVLGIAVREPRESVVTFATDLGLELPLLLDEDGESSDAYQVRGLPTTLFVDGKGVIAARHVGPLDQEVLDSYLSSLTSAPGTPAPTP